MSSTATATLPGLGYTLSAVALALRVVDLAEERIQATAGLSLSRAPGAAAASATAPEGAAGVLKFNARQMKITSVRVQRGSDGAYEPASFVLFDYLRRLVDPDVERDWPSLSACLAGDLEASLEGELHVTLPFPERPERLAVEVEYELEHPRGVVVFAQTPVPHAYTQTTFCAASELGGGCGARAWFPCVDTLRARYPLRLSIECARQNLAVGSGALVRTRPLGALTTLYEFEQDLAAPAGVGFAVGPFVKLAHPQAAWACSYVLPSRAASFDAELLPAAARALLEYLDVPPPPCYAQVFVAHEACFEVRAALGVAQLPAQLPARPPCRARAD
jgi:hypothetical protein